MGCLPIGADLGRVRHRQCGMVASRPGRPQISFAGSRVNGLAKKFGLITVLLDRVERRISDGEPQRDPHQVSKEVRQILMPSALTPQVPTSSGGK